MNNQHNSLQRAHISETIIDFYSLQPKVNKEILDRFEDFLIMIDSFYIETINQWELIQEENQLDLIELADLINGYLNFLNEEHIKIFKHENKLFNTVFINIDLDYMRFLECIKAWNAYEYDNLDIAESINDLEVLILDEKDFNIEFISFIYKLFISIHAEMIILIDDLI